MSKYLVTTHEGFDHEIEAGTFLQEEDGGLSLRTRGESVAAFASGHWASVVKVVEEAR